MKAKFVVIRIKSNVARSLHARDHVVPDTSVRVQSRVSDFEDKSLVVIGFEANDLDFFRAQLLLKWWTCLAFLVVNV